jgi:Fe-S-cluster containining protein
MLNCKTCNAPCCKEDTAVEKEGIGILDCEIAAFELNNYNIPLNKLGTKHAISYPCPLLTSDDRCRAYDIRPLACMLFPFQPGGTTEDGKQLLSVSHGCPSAREIVKQTYINLWRLIHRMEVVMAELHPKNQAKQAQK